MYRILIIETGEIIQTSTLRFVKKNPNSGAWIRVDNQADAEAISVAGRLFNLPNKTKIDGFDTAVIRNLDVAANLQNVEVSTKQNTADVNNLIDAVCDVGNDSDLLINAVLELSEQVEELRAQNQNANSPNP